MSLAERDCVSQAVSLDALDEPQRDVPPPRATSPVTAAQFINTIVTSPIFPAVYPCFSHPKCEFYSICGVFFRPFLQFVKITQATNLFFFFFSPVLLEKL